MLANFSPTARACFGSQASSPISSLSFLPITPPAALMSATAASAPFLSCVPNEAYWPVIGPATPMLMSWADAVPAKARPTPSATPASHIFFMPFSSSCGPLTSWSPRPRSSQASFCLVFAVRSPGDGAVSDRNFLAGAAAAPGQEAHSLIEPVVLRRHLGGARHPPRQRADHDEIERVDG